MKIMVLIRNQNGKNIIQSNIPEYDGHGKYDELYCKIHYSFRSTFNLPSGLNEKYTAKLYHIKTFQLYSMLFHLKMKNQLFSIYLHAC